MCGFRTIFTVEKRISIAVRGVVTVGGGVVVGGSGVGVSVPGGDLEECDGVNRACLCRRGVVEHADDQLHVLIRIAPDRRDVALVFKVTDEPRAMGVAFF